MATEDHTGIGASVKRKEDRRFVTGTGTYTDDIHVRGEVYAAFARSLWARARIEEVPVERSRRFRAFSRSSPARTWPRMVSATCPAAG